MRIDKEVKQVVKAIEETFLDLDMPTWKATLAQTWIQETVEKIIRKRIEKFYPTKKPTLP